MSPLPFCVFVCLFCSRYLILARFRRLCVPIYPRRRFFQSAPKLLKFIFIKYKHKLIYPSSSILFRCSFHSARVHAPQCVAVDNNDNNNNNRRWLTFKFSITSHEHSIFYRHQLQLHFASFNQPQRHSTFCFTIQMDVGDRCSSLDSWRFASFVRWHSLRVRHTKK